MTETRFEESPLGETVSIEGRALEIHRAGAAGGTAIVAAHPAEAFTAGTARLLAAASGRPVVCLNPRGIGGSSPEALGAMVDDLEAARRALGLERWIFWGMSGGGWLALLHAQRYPQAVAGLILESVCPCFRVRLSDPACVLSPFHPAWTSALNALGLLYTGSHDEVGDPSATEWDDIDGVGAVFRRRGGPALLVSPLPVGPQMRQVMPALWAFDARPWLPAVTMPALVVAGTADPVVPLAHARALQSGLGRATWCAVDGAGHVPTAQGRSEPATAVRAFLRDQAL